MGAGCGGGIRGVGRALGRAVRQAGDAAKPKRTAASKKPRAPKKPAAKKPARKRPNVARRAVERAADRLDPGSQGSRRTTERNVRELREVRRRQRAARFSAEAAGRSAGTSALRERGGRLGVRERAGRASLAELDNLNPRQQERVRQELREEYANIEDQIAQFVGRRDFTLRDIERAIKKEKRKNPDKPAVVKSMEMARDDWAELRAVVEPVDTEDVDPEEYAEAVRRLSPGRRNEVLQRIDLERTERALAQERFMAGQDRERAEIRAIEKDANDRLKIIERAHAKQMDIIRRLGQPQRDLEEDVEDLAELEQRAQQVQAMVAAGKNLLEVQKRRADGAKAGGVAIEIAQADADVAQTDLQIRAWELQQDFLNVAINNKQNRIGRGQRGAAANIPDDPEIDEWAQRVNVGVSNDNTARPAATGLLPKTKSADGANLGRYDERGYAVIERIDKGNAGIDTITDAVDHVANGGDLREVPDEFLASAIIKNGREEGQRFKIIGSRGGVNGMLRFKDTVTGKKLGVKFHSGDMYGRDEDLHEIVGVHMQQRFGFAAGSIRRNGFRRDGKGYVWVTELADNYLGRYAQPIEGKDDRNMAPGDAVRATLFDFAIMNTDRHRKNYFVKGPPDARKFIPIDHGLGFGSRRPHQGGQFDRNDGSSATFTHWMRHSRGGQMNDMIYGLQQRVRSGRIRRSDLIAEVIRIQGDIRRAEEELPLSDYLEHSWRTLGKADNPLVKNDGHRGRPAVLDRMRWIGEKTPQEIVELILKA